MMRSKVEFIDNKFYTSPGYDENLMKTKMTTRQELGVLIRVLGLIRGYRPWIFLPLTMDLLWGSLWLLVPFLDKILIDEVVPTEDWKAFWVVIGIGFFVHTQDQIIKIIKSHIGLFLNGRMGMWVQIQYYRHLQKIPLTYIERKGIGDHMYRLHGDTLGCISLPVRFWHDIIYNLYQFLLFLLFMSILDNRILIIVLVWEVFYMVTAQILGTWTRNVEFYVKQAKGLADARMQEGLAGVATVKTYGRRRSEVAGVIHRVSMQVRVEVLAKILSIVKATLLRGNGFFPYMKQYLILYILYWQVIHGHETYGTVVAVVAFLKIMERPIEKLVDLWQNLRFRMVQIARVFQVWDVKPPIVNIANPRPVPSFNGLIEARNVDFEYENGVQVLFDVNFKVDPGKFLAIVGPSGSGKSTMMNLLLRLYDPSRGSVHVDGNDIREYDCRKYQNNLGIVIQETFLSKESLRWNMMLGHYNASDEEMLYALERCRLKNWFDKLPHGLDSYLSEGTRISIGEKQRLGVARALLRNSNVLLLDEPTSSLDLETEEEVMDVIHGVRAGKTTVMVTHRLNTIVTADEIVVMENGKVLETGIHKDLLGLKKRYFDLYSLFAGSVIQAAQENAHSVT